MCSMLFWCALVVARCLMCVGCCCVAYVFVLCYVLFNVCCALRVDCCVLFGVCVAGCSLFVVVGCV